MSKDKITFVCRPEDKQKAVLQSAFRMAEMMLESGWVDITISRHKEKKTPPQHRTVWLWCTEAAYQLTELNKMTGKGGGFSKDDVYEIVYKGRCSAKDERTLPDGSIVYRPIGLSEATLEQTSEAMERFQVWASELGIELTQPDTLGL